MSQAGDVRGELVVGVGVEDLVHGALGREVLVSAGRVGRRGVRYKLREGHDGMGFIVIGVFADRQAALKIFDEHLTFTSVGPDKNLNGEIGNKAVAWRRRVLFVRDNVVVSLYFTRWSGDIERAAAAIDSSLAAGGRGVRRGETVIVPKIKDVEIPREIEAGVKAPVKIVVVLPQEGLGDVLSFADRYGVATMGPVLADPSGEVEIVRTAQWYTPRFGGPARSIWVCYATADCVVVSKEVKLPKVGAPAP